MKIFKALVKREYWEHRGGIYLTPMIMAAVFAGLTLIGGFSGDVMNIDGMSFSLSGNNVILEQLELLSEEKREKIFSLMLYSPGIIFGFVLLIVSLFYALGSLYDERKDRSILFWKSLPVSDVQTVFSKLFTIIVVAPILYCCAIIAFQIFMMLYITVTFWIHGGSAGLIWGSVNMFSIIFNSLLSLILASLWLSPLWGWCMLASSWAKRVAFLWAALPILMLVIAEGILFKSSRFIEVVSNHIAQGFVLQNGFIGEASDDEIFNQSDIISISDVFTNNHFWIGLLIAAVFIAGAIYTRRFRDES